MAVSWRWRSGDFPRLVIMVGPSGSGKSHVARGLLDRAEADEVVCLDDLRQAARVAGRISGTTRPSCEQGWTGSIPRWPPVDAWCGTPLSQRRPAVPGPRRGATAATRWSPTRCCWSTPTCWPGRNDDPGVPGAAAGPGRAAGPVLPAVSGSGPPHLVHRSGRHRRRCRRHDRRRGSVMRTSEEIYHRVRWDPRFDPARFVLGVSLRGAPAIRVPLPRFVPGGDIPWHRVVFIEADGEVVWDRSAGVDRLDASSRRPGARSRAACWPRSSPPARRTSGIRSPGGARLPMPMVSPDAAAVPGRGSGQAPRRCGS